MDDNIQQQIDELREQVNLLTDTVDKLLDIYEMEHGITHDPETGELILPDKIKPGKNHHNPYL